ncbi:MAG: hypothetical protein IKW00_09885 [Clostridia bacterium]|nr:hypothetical protein [Clostridia bacterium]
MTREMFLEELKEALCGLDAEEIESVVAYYSEMIEDRIEAGMSEEDAVAAMEPVDTIAARVLGDALPEEEDRGESAPQTEEKNENVKEIRKNAEDIAELVITATNQRVYVTTGETEEIVLRYRIEKGDVYQLHEENGVLTLEHNYRPVTSYKPDLSKITAENFLDEVGKFLGSIDLSGIVRFGQQLTEPRAIEVLLPRIFKGELRIKTVNDRIKLDSVTCLNDVKLKTCNARIVVRNVVAQTLSAHTANARIEMSDVYARDRIDAVTSNGRIIAENVTGDDAMHLRTSNASVKTENIGAGSIEIKTSNGSVSGTVKGSEEEYAIQSGTSNGKCNLNDSFEGEKKLVVKTSNASIHMEFIG